VASGMVFLDGTVVNVAIRRIGEELPSSVFGTLEAQAYITSGYLAVLSAFLILAGALADKYGRRRIFLIGLAAFGLTSILAGVAPNMEFLVVARLMQGAAGALLVPGSLSIITAAFEGPARARAFGLWAAATSALIVLGPLVGGILVDTVSWRMAFLINVPFAIVAFWAAWQYVPESKDPNAPERLDWLGSIVIAIAVGGIAFGLIRGYETDWNDTVALVALGAGIVAAILFPIMMVKRRDSLIPPDLFRRRAFAVINASTFLIYGALYVTQFLQFLYLQGTLGYTALAAALVVLPTGLILVLGSTRVGSLSGRIGVWPFLVLGPVLMALSQLWLARIPADSEAWVALAGAPETWIPPASAIIDVLPASLLFGLGITLVVAPLTTALMGSIPVANAGLGSALNNAISRVGQPLVLAVLFVVISASFYETLADMAPQLDTSSAAVRSEIQPLNRPPAGSPAVVESATAVASTDAFRLAMLATAGLLGLGALVNAVGLERKPKLAADEPGEREMAETESSPESASGADEETVPAFDPEAESDPAPT
ncbi:MAG: MFS transporter, partial [Chloroflexota bacterium]